MMMPSEATLMNAHNTTPWSKGRQPTLRSVCAERPAPMRKSVKVSPVVAVCESAGAAAATSGT